MTEEARELADELAEWKQAASVEAGLRREFQEAEAKLGAAYLRLRTLIPGAFDTPHAPTGEQVWETTEKALIAALLRSQLAREAIIEQAIADFYPLWERKPDFARFIAAALVEAK